VSGEGFFMADGYFILKLSISQRMALVDLIVEHYVEPRTSAEFVDIVRDVTTTPMDLLKIVDQAKFFPVSVAPEKKAVSA